jgi:hypothetical protein
MHGSDTMNGGGTRKIKRDEMTFTVASKEELSAPPLDPPATPAEVKVVKKEKKTNPWNEHVKAFRAAHPDMKFKEVLKEAAKTYTKKVSE